MDNFLQALKWAQQYCSKAERCAGDVLNKLGKYKLDETSSKRLLENLRKENYLNDTRYAKAYAIDQFRFSRWGKIKIRYMLRLKGLAETDIQEALEQIPLDEYLDLLKALIDEKQKHYAGSEAYETKARLLRFAYGRGFEPDLINQCLDSSKNY
ncbi:MAG: regulatory protein RecX [Bacteroidales bacterium]|jgi:regulatory protein|nr:regulatory protein RecX [Bacteroidales bacterium]MDD3430433.1 regulatory protein RecX [Bacteroidales bacterium]MDD4361094.1 regulatory protein RecX [Bacteroidales bacterium]MDD4430109.1 regulatory protein RecX [Bacteroidales bacterium]